MAKFENLRKLPDVLDDIHRQSVIKTLAIYGIRLSLDAPWAEVGERANGDDRIANSPYTLLAVQYKNSPAFGPLVGDYHTIDNSGTTERAEHHPDISPTLGIGNSKWYREIVLRNAQKKRSLSGRIVLPRDSPPLAFHLDDYSYIQEKIPPDDFVLLPEHEVANKIKDAFGPESVEYVTDEMAGKIIQALRSAEAYTPKC